MLISAIIILLYIHKFLQVINSIDVEVDGSAVRVKWDVCKLYG